MFKSKAGPIICCVLVVSHPTCVCKCEFVGGCIIAFALAQRVSWTGERRMARQHTRCTTRRGSLHSTSHPLRGRQSLLMRRMLPLNNDARFFRHWIAIRTSKHRQDDRTSSPRSLDDPQGNEDWRERSFLEHFRLTGKFCGDCCSFSLQVFFSQQWK